MIHDVNGHGNYHNARNDRGVGKKNGHSNPFHQELLDIEVPSKDDIIKETIKIKASRFRNIFSKDLCVEKKARLREDSPESPKRILDCVKRYN